MTTKYGPTLNPGEASLYRRTEKPPAVPPCDPAGARAEEPAPGAAVRLRNPPADGPAALIAGSDIRAASEGLRDAAETRDVTAGL
jgi:hypothetical protein